MGCEMLKQPRKFFTDAIINFECNCFHICLKIIEIAGHNNSFSFIMSNKNLKNIDSAGGAVPL